MYGRFGLAKAFREKDGKLRMKRENADFRGTTLYASPYAHEGEDQCPRDDVFSLLFVFCDLVCGQVRKYFLLSFPHSIISTHVVSCVDS